MESSTGAMPFKLGSDEVIVKDYEAAIMRLPKKMVTYIILTNKRAILFAHVKNMLGLKREYLLDDIHVDEIGGVVAYIGHMRSLTNLIAGIFLLILGFIFIYGDMVYLYGYYSTHIPLFFGIGLVLVGILLLLLKKKIIYVHIKGKHIPGIELGVVKKGPIQIYDAKPGKDADVMVLELSAVIADIQAQQTEKSIEDTM